MITKYMAWLKWWHVIVTFAVVHLVAVYLFAQGYLPTFFDPLINLSDLDHENSLGTYYSFILLFLSAAGAFFIANTATVKNSSFFFWAVLATLFLYMSIDESLSLHERVMGPLEDVFGDTFDGTVFAFTWLLIGIPFLGAFVLTLSQLSQKIPSPTKKRLGLALLIYFAGAFGFEAVAGIADASPLVYRTVITGTEEILEIIGITLAFSEVLRNVRIKISAHKTSGIE